jgi:hypothetical protein
VIARESARDSAASSHGLPRASRFTGPSVSYTPYVRREHPTFSWSHTRQQTFDACARRYYWTYYGSHNGWEPGAPRSARLAWALKQLTTYPLALGTAVHDQARRVALAVRDGHPPPAYDVLRASARGALNRLYLRSRDRAAFARAPSRHPITVDAYYGRRPAPALFERLREKLGRCLTNLLDQPLWDELSGAPAGAVRVVDALATVPIDGVPVYVAPDLVVRTPRAGSVVVDWKTGSADGAPAQLALYTMFVRDVLGLPARGDTYEARVVQLETGRTAVHHVTTDDREAARARVADGVRRMRAYLVDPVRNVPTTPETFPLADDRRACHYCRYRALCESELRPSPSVELRDMTCVALASRTPI